MKYVAFYESAPDVRERAAEFFPAHRARWTSFAERGELLMIGPFENPLEGAMAIFTTREAAEAFISEDPFVTNGLVSRWYIRGWREALVPEPTG